MVLSLVPALAGWVSTSQARYGAQISGIQNESRGVVAYPIQQTLGYLWSTPSSAHSTTGFGNTITWAWDPKLCDLLLNNMEEDFWEMSFIGCAEVRASLHRAFETWAMNHKYIKFTDVTEECAKRGTLNEGCALAEVWVTYLNASSPTYGVLASSHGDAAQDAAQSVPFVRYNTAFQYTNSRSPILTIGNNIIPRQVIETHGGRLSFNTADPICWYLDSSFCSGWHDLKRENGPDGVYAFSVFFLFFWWGVAMFVATMHFMLVLRNVLRANSKLLTKDKPLWKRVGMALLLSAEELGPYRLVMRLLLIMIPWAFYKAIFLTCWDCYDFEATAAHEIGHLLGLGHPNLVPNELIAGSGPAGQNSYHTVLASGGELNVTNCMYPWDYVVEGVPPGLVTGADVNDLNPTTGRRYSIMDAVDKNNPRTCLTADDLEGLNVLYPTCSGAITVPICMKQSLKYLGWMRVCVFIIGPAILAIMTTGCILIPKMMYDYRERRKAEVGSIARVGVEPTSSTTGVAETVIVQPPEVEDTRQDV